MSDIFGTIRILILCGSVLFLAFMVLLSLPQSPLRGVVLQLVGWVLAVFCGVYCISPIDIMPEILLGPFGLVDDIGALVLGCYSAKTALDARKEV